MFINAGSGKPSDLSSRKVKKAFLSATDFNQTQSIGTDRFAQLKMKAAGKSRTGEMNLLLIERKGSPARPGA
jgi:hypothetical protein